MRCGAPYIYAWVMTRYTTLIHLLSVHILFHNHTFHMSQQHRIRSTHTFEDFGILFQSNRQHQYCSFLLHLSVFSPPVQHGITPARPQASGEFVAAPIWPHIVHPGAFNLRIDTCLLGSSTPRTMGLLHHMSRSERAGKLFEHRRHMKCFTLGETSKPQISIQASWKFSKSPPFSSMYGISVEYNPSLFRIRPS